MGYCPNCKTRLTCSCQKRVSSKGIACCSNCISKLNAQPQGIAQPVKQGAVQPPTGTTVTYTGPGTQI
jgi:hypothetical protein